MNLNPLRVLKPFIDFISGKNKKTQTKEEANKRPSSRKRRKRPVEDRGTARKFSDLGLPPLILQSVLAMGFTEMTPVQEATYPAITAGRDLCALAETGSGKTAACAIPLVQKIDTSKNAIQGLVIVPTRELCIQYVDEIEKIGSKSGVVSFAVFGGFSKDIQTAKIKHEVHVLVATPGRLIDLLYDGVVSLAQVKCVVLDEADELLMEGFLEDIEFIMSCMLNEHQTLLFAATMNDDVKKLTHNYLKEPVYLSLIEKRAAPLSIEHYFSYVHPKQKEEALLKYLNEEDVSQAIIFCNARHKVDKLFGDMKKTFRDIDYIHAGLNQNKRSSLFRQFKSKKLRYLIATDVAGRGLDFTHVSHVLNWDFPDEGAQYTHRTGRSGRMGRKGKAFSLITRRDLPKLQDLIRKKQINARWIGRNPLQNNSKPSKPRTTSEKGKSRHYRSRKNRGH